MFTWIKSYDCSWREKDVILNKHISNCAIVRFWIQLAVWASSILTVFVFVLKYHHLIGFAMFLIYTLDLNSAIDLLNVCLFFIVWNVNYLRENSLRKKQNDLLETSVAFRRAFESRIKTHVTPVIPCNTFIPWGTISSVVQGITSFVSIVIHRKSHSIDFSRFWKTPF